jgi:hypothetical protein
MAILLVSAMLSVSALSILTVVLETTAANYNTSRSNKSTYQASSNFPVPNTTVNLVDTGDSSTTTQVSTNKQVNIATISHVGINDDGIK